MRDAFLQYVVPAALGLVGGAIGSVVAPWANWGVEQKRELLRARRAIIARWRELLADRGMESEVFAGSAEYSALREYLPEDLRRSLESDRTFIVPNQARDSGANPYAPQLLDEVARIEREWGLV